MKRRKLTTTLAAVLAAAMLVTGCGADTDRNPDEVTTQEHDEDTMVHLESLDEVSALFDDVYAGYGFCDLSDRPDRYYGNRGHLYVRVRNWLNRIFCDVHQDK